MADRTRSVFARLERQGEADRLGREAVSIAEQTDSVDLHANALLCLAEVLTAADRPNEAGSFRARAIRLLSRKDAIATAAVGGRAGRRPRLTPFG